MRENIDSDKSARARNRGGKENSPCQARNADVVAWLSDGLAVWVLHFSRLPFCSRRSIQMPVLDLHRLMDQVRLSRLASSELPVALPAL
jgi:hypothetical protein